MVKRTIDERTVTVGELLDILTEKEEELDTQFQSRTLEYARKFSHVKGEEEKELMDELLELDDINKDEAANIVNLMPSTKEELKTIFYHRKTILMEDFLDSVQQILDKYRDEE